MKKLLIFVSIFALTITLSACDMLNGKDPSEIVCEEGYTLNDEGTCVIDEDETKVDPLICPTGQTEVDGACVVDEEELTCPVGEHVENDACVPDEEELTCPVGEHVENDACVVDTVTCSPDYHEEAGACVPDEGTDVYRTMVLDSLITQMNNNPVYLGVIMQDMTFDQGMSVTYEVNFEVTKDVDLEESIRVVIVDTMVGDMLQRELTMTVDDETLEFAIFYEDGESGVKVYIQPGTFIEQLRLTDPEAAERLEWVGFDKEWAVFEFDESLETMIQMDILKDMLTTMFFNEMGVSYFYELQADFEIELGFDLNQYGIDLGMLVDDVLDEDYDAATLALESIDQEGLMLHIDCLYVAPELFGFIENYETELKAQGFRYDDLAPLLDTAHWDYTDPDEDVLVLDAVLDGSMGTEAFLDALTEADKEAVVAVFKEALAEELYYNVRSDMVLDTSTKSGLAQMFIQNETEFMTKFNDAARYTELRDMFGTDMWSDYDLVAVWKEFTPEEIEWLKSLATLDAYNEWMYYTLEEVNDYLDLEVEIVDFLNDHKTVLEDSGYDVDAFILEIETNGVEVWIEGLDEQVFAPLLEDYLFTFIDDLELAYEEGNGLEFMMNTVFSDPHVVSLLAEMGTNPYFVSNELAGDMLAINWNIIGTETLDLEALAVAIQEGPAAFTAFLAANETSAPNMVLFLGIFEPAVESVQPYMMYIDDMEYAIDGLSAFDGLLDLDYYMDDILDMDMTGSEDITLVVEMEVDGLAYAMLFDDFTDDLYIYLSGFTSLGDLPYDENWECLDSEDEYCEDIDVTYVKQILLGLDSSTITLELDPSDLSWANIDVDFTALLNGLVEAQFQTDTERMQDFDSSWTVTNGDGYVTGVTTATVSVSMSEVSVLEAPAEADTVKMNDLANDLGRFMVSLEAYSYVEQLAMMYAEDDDYSALAAMYNTPTYLGDVEGLRINGAFDETISYFVVTGNIMNPSTLHFELELFWVDGEEVFTDALNFNELLPLYLNDEIVSEAAYDALVSYPDSDSFALTRVWLMLAMMENTQEKIEMGEY